MKSRVKLVLLLVPMMGVLLTGCTSSRLQKRAFEGQRIAATAAFPPEAKVRHMLLAVDSRRLPSVFRTERRELERLQSVLTETTKQIDIPGYIVNTMVRTGADALGATISNDPQTADYVLDFRVYDYGLRVSRTGGSAKFYINSEATIWDQQKEEIIWRERLNRTSSFRVQLGGSRINEITKDDLEDVLADFTTYVTERMQTALHKDIKE